MSLGSLIDAAEIEIPCPACGEQIAKTIGWLRDKDQLDCPNCGVTIILDRAQLEDGISEVEKALDGLSKLF